MARTLITPQGQEFALPEEGEVFRTPTSFAQGGVIFTIKGGKLGSLPTTQAEQLGIDVRSLPSFSDEVFTVAERLGLSFRGDAKATPQDFLPRPVMSTGETIRATPAPENPNFPVLTSSARGQLSGAVPTPQGVATGREGPGGFPILQSPALSPLPTPGVGTFTDVRELLQQGNRIGQAAQRFSGQPFTPTQFTQQGAQQPGQIPQAPAATSRAIATRVEDLNVVAGVAKAIEDAKKSLEADITGVSGFLSTRKTARSILEEEFKKRGIEESQSLLSQLNKTILEQTQLLRKIPENLKTTLADVGVTQAQLDRLILAESKKPTEILRDLLEQRNVLKSDINQAMEFAEKFTDIELKDEATRLKAMEIELQYDEKLLNELNETQKKILDLAFKEREQILEIAKDIPDPAIRDQVLSAGSAAEALQRAGPSLGAGSTDDIREYQFAVGQGFRGDFLSFKKAQQNELLNTLRGLQIQGLTGGFVSVPSTEVNTALTNALRQAILPLPQNNRFGYEQQFDRLMDAGNIEGARELVLSAALDSATAEEQKQVIGRAQAMKALTTIESELDKFIAAGGNTNVFTGTAEQIAQKLGATTDPQLAGIANKMQIALFDYRRAMTGVQFSAAEGEQYRRIFPAIINLDNLNKAKISSLRETMLSNQEVFYRTRLGSSNYDAVIGGRGLGAFSGQTQAPPPEDEIRRRFEERQQRQQQPQTQGVQEGAADSISSFFNKVFSFFR